MALPSDPDPGITAESALRSPATAVHFVAASSRLIVETGAAAVPLLGYRPAEIVGQPWTVLFTPESAADGTPDHIAEALRTSGVWTGELPCRRRDGSTFWCFVTVAASEHPRHGPVWVLTHTDRTTARQAAADLRRTAERLHLAADVTDVAVWEWDLTTGAIFWDARMFALFDIPSTPSFRYEQWAATLHPDDRERTEAVLRQLFAGATRVTCEYRILRRDGAVRHMHAEGKSWADAAGRVTRIVGVNLDVTEPKRVEATMRENQEKFARAFYRAPVFMSITTLDTGTYVDVNEHAVAMTGFRREEMIGHTSVGIGLITAEDRQCLADTIVRDGRVAGHDLPFRRKDGTPGMSRIHAESLTIAGQPCLLLIAIDVTEARKIEARIRQLSQAVEQSPSAVIITDPSGQIEYVNPKFCQVTGYTAAEVMGRNPRFLKSGDMPAEAYRKLWQTITAGGTWRGVFHNRTKSGQSYWEDATLSPIRDAAGRITHFLAVKEDVTARKQLEERYRHAQKMEAVGQLAGGLAHDYNNVLTATILQLSLLQQEPDLTSAVRAGLRELEHLAARSARLTRQLLTFSRQQPVEVAPLEFHELLKNLLGMLRRLLSEKVRLDYRRPPEPLWISADAGMMEQVVTNLAVNARDAMAERGGTLVIQPERIMLDVAAAEKNPDAYPGAFARLTVSDEGCGMAPATLKHIFEPFFTTKGVGQGTGLGLATVFGIVQQHRGWVEVDSAEGRGSTFHVYLPCLEHGPSAAAADAGPDVARGSETILVVEDEFMVRRTTVAGLESHGYRVLSAPDAPAALALWQEHRAAIAVLVTDMVMPRGLNGLELAIDLRRSKPALSVVICSGYSRALGEAGLSQVPGAVYLPKPYELPKLAAVVRRLCDGA